MYKKEDIKRVYWLIDEYLKGKINESTFCDEFYYSYDLGIDKDSLSNSERKAFSGLSQTASRFSEFEEDHKLDSKAFSTANELKNKVIETKFHLDNQGFKFTDWMNFVFIKHPSTCSFKDAYVAHLGEIQNKKSLFDEYKKKLKLPICFEYNWDSLSDCLKDLHWILEKKIIIIHNNSPKLNAHDLQIYLNLLNRAICDWKFEGQYNLEVVFSDDFRATIL